MTVHEEDAPPARGVPASEFHQNDPLRVLAGLLEENLLSAQIRSAVAMVTAELKAYREAAADRYTEARVTGIYRDTWGKMQETTLDFTSEFWDDPVGEALSTAEKLTRSGDTGLCWVEPPTIWLRECITTEWVEWNDYA